ncbi:MAG: hypothetical protein EOP51_21100 [Sphingobacteriales bacterium]|nr:MAG: hypothetical protein EOP51_21100 [Sphingobacteriales bacterium]
MEMREVDIELLWLYVDGQCSEADQLLVNQLLANNAHWQQAYHEIIAFEQTLSNSSDLEQPSMRFTKNVMDAVQAEGFAHKKAGNRLVWVFGTIMSMLTIVLVITGFTDIDWAAGKSVWSFSQVQIDRSKIVFITLAINTVLALVLLDTLLKRKRPGNS